MPVRRGHVAPQNTFLDTIIRKFEGQSEWGRGGGEGALAAGECARARMGGRARASASAGASRWGLEASGRWLGVERAGLGAGGCGLPAKGPGVGMRVPRLRSGFWRWGVCVRHSECAGQGDGMAVLRVSLTLDAWMWMGPCGGEDRRRGMAQTVAPEQDHAFAHLGCVRRDETPSLEGQCLPCSWVCMGCV